MKSIKENKVKIPSFTSIDEIIQNSIFNENGIKLELFLHSKNDKFKLNLKGTSKNFNFFIDTNISIELHPDNEKHPEPHIQWDISQIENNFFKNGNLHINLLVNTEEDLLHCCKGFINVLGEILEHFEKELQLNKSLKNHFFNEEIIKFEKYKETLYDFIEDAFEKDVFELTGQKSFNFKELNSNKKLFYIIRLFHSIPMLKPLLQIPTYNQFIKIPHIKKQNIKFDEVDLLITFLLNNDHAIEMYTPEKLMIEYEKM